MTIFFENYLGYEEARKSMVVVWSLMGFGYAISQLGNTYVFAIFFSSNLCWVLKTTQ